MWYRRILMPAQRNGEAAMKKCSGTCVGVSERVGQAVAVLMVLVVVG